MENNPAPAPNRKLLGLIVLLVVAGAGGLAFLAGRATTTVRPSEATLDAGMPALVIAVVAACVVAPLLYRMLGFQLRDGIELMFGALLAVVALAVLIALTCSAAHVGLSVRPR